MGSCHTCFGHVRGASVGYVTYATKPICHNLSEMLIYIVHELSVMWHGLQQLQEVSLIKKQADAYEPCQHFLLWVFCSHKKTLILVL